MRRFKVLIKAASANVQYACAAALHWVRMWHSLETQLSPDPSKPARFLDCPALQNCKKKFSFFIKLASLGYCITAAKTRLRLEVFSLVLWELHDKMKNSYHVMETALAARVGVLPVALRAGGCPFQEAPQSSGLGGDDFLQVLHCRSNSVPLV